MDGLCQCGCGERTPLAKVTHANRGLTRGQPLRFIHGHNRVIVGLPDDWVLEDHGYVTPCQVWQRSLTRHGYGRVTVNRKVVLAHRAFYEQAHGAIPSGLDLDHLCRVPACVNPAHLEPVTHVENVRRGLAQKLTADDVAAICAARTRGESFRGIGLRFGVSHQRVRTLACCEHGHHSPPRT